MSNRVPDIDNVFTQLDAALCLLARAKGQQPQQTYFVEKTKNVRHLILDGGAFQVVMTVLEPEDK